MATTCILWASSGISGFGRADGRSIAYKLDEVGSEEEIIIATTRPETLLGDTAIAVHPDDERYKVTDS